MRERDRLNMKIIQNRWQFLPNWYLACFLMKLLKVGKISRQLLECATLQDLMEDGFVAVEGTGARLTDA